jgi:hypothetical protein
VWYVVVYSLQRYKGFYVLNPGGGVTGWPYHEYQDVIEMRIADTGEILSYATSKERL